jgi:hypothetical protein
VATQTTTFCEHRGNIINLKKAIARLAMFVTTEHPWIRLVPATPMHSAFGYTTDGTGGMLVWIDPEEPVYEDVTMAGLAAAAAVKTATAKSKSTFITFRSCPVTPKAGRLVQMEVDIPDGGGEAIYIPAAMATDAGGLPAWPAKPVFAKLLLNHRAFVRVADIAGGAVTAPGLGFVLADPQGLLGCDGVRACRYAHEGLVTNKVLVQKKLAKAFPSKPHAVRFCFDEMTGLVSLVVDDEVRFCQGIDARIYPKLAPTIPDSPLGVLVEGVPVTRLKQAVKFAIVASTAGLVELLFTPSTIIASGILMNDARRTTVDVHLDVHAPGLNSRQVFSGRMLWDLLDWADGDSVDLIVGSGTQTLGILDGGFVTQVIPQWKAENAPT